MGNGHCGGGDSVCNLHCNREDLGKSRDVAPTPGASPASDGMRLPHAAAESLAGTSSGRLGDSSSSKAAARGREEPTAFGGEARGAKYFDREAEELLALPPLAPGSAGASVRSHKSYKFRTGASYEGQWLGRARDGFGVQRWPDGAAFMGQWVEDRAAGLGSLRHCNGDVYIGEWQNNMANGRGVYRHEGDSTAYAGEFRDDLQDGFGVELWAERARYEGSFHRGKKHGHGRYVWPDGSMYSGGWHWNSIEGLGDYQGQDGRRFSGSWVASCMEGPGVATWPDGCIYEGQYGGDQKHGFGIFRWPDGRRYEGFWRAGQQHGVGLIHIEETELAEWGQWREGRRIS